MTVISVTPTLYASPATVQAVGRARAAVVLVGGYDGSANYGDIALLEAALGLIERLSPDLMVLPVLEREYLDGHRVLAEHWADRQFQPLFFDPEGRLEDGLLPVAAPADLAFGACYLYGGGYLNGSWGERKLAMLRAAEALLEAGGAGQTCRISSGLQVDDAWISRIGEEDVAALRSFDFLGVRDAASGRALEKLGSAAPATDTGDDAVGLLVQPVAAEVPVAADGSLRVNVHFAEHPWVSERPEAVLDFYVRFLAELGRLSGRQVVAHPVIAYLDGRIDERPAVERLAAACSAVGVEVAEPVVLQPASLDAVSPRLREATLTLSCSFHVALTSLMLAVPAVLIADSPYYAQKSAGLAEHFGLPSAFTAEAGEDPVAAAGEVAEAVLGEEQAAELRRRLAAGASRLRQTRAATEAELLGRLGGAAVTGLGDRVAALTERLRERSAEPAELRVRLAELQTERDELERLAGESPVEAEIRAAEAREALAAVVGSRSWRLSSPLRRAGEMLRRR